MAISFAGIVNGMVVYIWDWCEFMCISHNQLSQMGS